MPLGELAGEALGGVLRLIGRIVAEIFFELLIQGTGELLLRLFRPESKLDARTSMWVGVLFWGCLIPGAYWLYRQVLSS